MTEKAEGLKGSLFIHRGYYIEHSGNTYSVIKLCKGAIRRLATFDKLIDAFSFVESIYTLEKEPLVSICRQ